MVGKLKGFVHNVLKKNGKQLVSYPDSATKRHKLIIQNQNIDIILDIGANTGQYANSLREIGYQNKIVSFEPMLKAYGELEENAKGDNLWDVKNYALGDTTGSTVINISGNSYSSSILNMLPTHSESAPASKYVSEEKIEIKRLDEVFDMVCEKHTNVMIKVDTQGFEKSVLDGAEGCLDRILIIELELSLVPLYEDGFLYQDIIKFLENQNFELFALEHVFSNPKTGQLLQVDGIFVRKD